MIVVIIRLSPRRVAGLARGGVRVGSALTAQGGRGRTRGGMEGGREAQGGQGGTIFGSRVIFGMKVVKLFCRF